MYLSNADIGMSGMARIFFYNILMKIFYYFKNLYAQFNCIYTHCTSNDYQETSMVQAKDIMKT